MKDAVKILTLLGGGYEAYLRNLSPTAWWRLRETAGSIAVNAMYGSGVGAELLADPGIEAWTSPTNLTSWAETLGGTSTINQETTVIHGGSNAARLDIDASNNTAIISQNIGTVGDTYRFSVWARASATPATAAVISGVAFGSFSLTTAYQQFVQDVIAQNANLGFLRLSAASKSIYFDDCSIVKIGELDAALTAVTLGQTGKFGANEAFDFDGATSLGTVYNRASIQGLTELWLMGLVNPDGPGELNAGTLFSKAGEFELRFNSASRDLIATVEYDTTDAQTITTTALATGAWSLVTMKINNTTKTVRIFINGVEASYSGTPTAGVGTRVSNTNNLIIGNNSGATQTWDGLWDDAAIKGAEISDAQELQLARLAGVAA
jgi:hypothetical protein